MQKKLVMLFGAIILAFVFLIGWITYINASKGEKYTKVVLDQQQYNNRTIPFKRGDIVDRNGTKLATSERVYNVVVDAKTITSNKKYINPTIKALSKCFDLKKKDVRKQIKKNPNSRYLVLKKGVNYEAYQKFEKITSDTDKNPNVQGVWMEEDYTRKYPYKTLASDVIGFTTNGNVGSNGIEASYNSILNGTDGREYGYLDEDSGYERTVKEPDNGSTVVSTIDLQVQSIVEQHILEFNEEHKNTTPFQNYIYYLNKYKIEKVILPKRTISSFGLKHIKASSKILKNDSISVMLKENSPFFYYCYECSTIDDYMIASFLELIENDYLISKCENCGKYFIAYNRADTLYCDRISPQNASKNCKQYGKEQKWLERTKNEKDWYSLYRKVYQTFQKKAIRNPGHKESKQAFDNFRAEANEWKQAVKKGSKTEADFMKWLKSFRQK